MIHELTDHFTIITLCKIAGVSKSGYYKWLKRQDNPTDKELDDQSIVTKIIKCQQDPDINWSYGYPRVQTWLKKTYGLKVNHKRIYRLMKANGIQAKIREKKWKHFGRKEKYVVSENDLNREFSATRPNEKWVTDITYLLFNGKKHYLSAILDLYNNEIISYKISERNDLKLVADTVKEAIKKREVKGLLLHSDQGFQYTSIRYNKLLKRCNMKQSMSRKGNCLDNACMESFFSHFKAECFYRYQFDSSNEVKEAVKNYMKFYNHKRFQKKLNNLSPTEYRAKAA
ncbi:integrase [Peribacillus loiseleuriae]|uniref:Integrase n=1 Tax=Peribacillus loiseleuriae TaxID=1679170 RepID=A0A0K9GT08_9BACI|nr:integrase [Peribacillus loiseleuriae]KMY49751.1 integrase [Peribacillus loiseleuriae]KMY49828.1 integrase [Peribacillus loiseleuriae]